MESSKPEKSGEQPVPDIWRPRLRAIANSFAQGDFALESRIAGVEPLPPETAAQIALNVKDYGATLTRLPEATWESSVCSWNGYAWDVLVDLWTAQEGRSDLVLHAQVLPDDGDDRISVHLVYVP